MAAEIEFPDGTRATIRGRTWESADPQVKAVAEYFSESLPFGYYPDRQKAIARHVVSMIVGARVVWVEPPRPSVPGRIY